MYTGYLFCEHCEAPTHHPIWIRYEHLEYRALCVPCYRKIHETFTAEQAVCQALIVVGMWQGAHPIGGMR